MTSGTTCEPPRAVFTSDAVKAQLNQYWYSTKTIRTILSEVLHHATRAAFLSTPSLFFALDQPLSSDETEEDARRRKALRSKSVLLEYDRQWESDAGFVFYDFRKPDHVPVQHMGKFDYVIADPPFITEDVWTAYIHTAKLLLVSPSSTNGVETQVDESSHPPPSSHGMQTTVGNGKVLFTTILENHTTLESLLNGPLYIPHFRPLVHHLTYQYVCFTNYVATKLNQIRNDEVEEEDEKIRAGIEMANTIRLSEEAFALQMQTRPREAGEQLLPTTAYQKECEQQRDHPTNAAQGEPHRDAANGEAIKWESTPLEKMPWGHIPESLRVFLETTPQPQEDEEKKIHAEAGKEGTWGNDAKRNVGDVSTLASNNEEGVQSTGGASLPSEETASSVAVAQRQALRQEIDAFKGRIDKVQQILHEELRAKAEVLKRRKAWQEEVEKARNANDTNGGASPSSLPNDHPESGGGASVVDGGSAMPTGSERDIETKTVEVEADEEKIKKNVSAAFAAALPPAVAEAQLAREAVYQRRMNLVHEMAALAESITQKERALLRTVSVFPKNETETKAGGVEMTTHEEKISEKCPPVPSSSSSSSVGEADDTVPLPAYVGNMNECVERYRAVEIKKSVLLELASVATGRYKAPLFGRMRSLLEEIKVWKAKKE